MLRHYIFISLFVLISVSMIAQPVVVVHGGAGNYKPEELPEVFKKEYFRFMNQLLDSASKWLNNGATALEVVTKVVMMLEDCPLFNAGKGAVLNSKGEVELDASVMDGKTLKAGAVACVKHVKNPVLLARKVMENTSHVLLVGEGAEAFAKELQLEMVDNSYFITPESIEKFTKWKEKLKTGGTVGCVALDVYGNIAAATSTGGLIGKKWGRVGDTPIIGAGTYADNNYAGVSCTGYGEYFIRNSVAYDVIAQMKYANKPLTESAKYVINNTIKNQGGYGGLIAIDKQGNVVVEYNTTGMHYAYIDKSGKKIIKE
ncbi:MAG: isoaspartyl peptidase/L-asparaginase [Bacteroidales bacterium]|nr:isoaspartyl peptidase/L-asparaginase [Bacteroidales bacterium]